MKRKIALLLSLVIISAAGCKKEQKQPEEEVSLAKKYAKYSIQVFKDAEMKKWLTSLSKSESVDLLNLTKKMHKKKEIEIARVKLSDDTIGYINSSHLADKPIVFIEDVKAHLRNNIGSKVVVTIPRGTIGFIVSEKGGWTQVYIGKLEGKWITKQWVNGGFSTDENLVLDARTFEESVNILEKDPEKVKPVEIEEAKEKLKELSKSASIIAEMAAEKYNSIENITIDDTKKDEIKEETAKDSDTSSPDDL